MPAVLWGVACLSLPGPTTAADVSREFREAVIRGVGVKSSSSENCGDNCLPRVDLYRLVRIEDQTDCRLTGEEQVVAHLPDSPWGCRDIEEIYRQKDEAEIRYDRARESLVSLMESLDFGEVAPSPSIVCQDVGQVLSTQGLPMSPQAQQLCNVAPGEQSSAVQIESERSHPARAERDSRDASQGIHVTRSGYHAHARQITPADHSAA